MYDYQIVSKKLLIILVFCSILFSFFYTFVSKYIHRNGITICNNADRLTTVITLEPSYKILITTSKTTDVFDCVGRSLNHAERNIDMVIATSDTSRHAISSRYDVSNTMKISEHVNRTIRVGELQIKILQTKPFIIQVSVRKRTYYLVENMETLFSEFKDMKGKSVILFRPPKNMSVIEKVEPQVIYMPLSGNNESNNRLHLLHDGEVMQLKLD